MDNTDEKMKLVSPAGLSPAQPLLRWLRVVIVVVLTVAMGGWLAACGPDGSGTPKTVAPKTSFAANFSRVEESLRVRWSVTNTGNQPILAFDRILPSDGVFDPDVGNGAYVIGRPDGTIEIAMRAFPVPKGIEGVQAYVFHTTRLAPGASTGGNLIVLLPFRHRPAAPVKGGGDLLPANPRRAVFCLGVIAADSRLVSQARDSEHPVLPHIQRVADAQTRLCSDPFALV